MSHCPNCNFSIISEFKYIGDSERKKNRTPADSKVQRGTRIWNKGD
jgi:sarcosine oxidase delta subunit